MPDSFLVPTNQTHQTVISPMLSPTAVTVITGPPLLSWTVSPTFQFMYDSPSTEARSARITYTESCR